jgi:hypothetical protein
VLHGYLDDALLLGPLPLRRALRRVARGQLASCLTVGHISLCIRFAQIIDIVLGI